MVRPDFWKSDWFFSAGICLVFLVAWGWGTALLEGFERNAYDLGVRVSSRDVSRPPRAMRSEPSRAVSRVVTPVTRVTVGVTLANPMCRNRSRAIARLRVSPARGDRVHPRIPHAVFTAFGMKS